MSRRNPFVRAFAFLLFALVACGDDAAKPGDDGGTPASDAAVDLGPPRAIFVLPRAGDEPFFDLPWPTDIRRDDDGTIDVKAFPDPTGNTFVQQYKSVIDARPGYATNGAVYFRFSRTLDDSTLPKTPEESMADDASVFLVALDGDRPERWPAVAVYRDETTRYWPGRTLAIRPVYGFPLAPASRYAAVVTRRVRATGGEELGRDADFDAMLAGADPVASAARDVAQPALDALDALGVALDDVLSLTVFTTDDPVSELFAATDWLIANYPEPTVVDLRYILRSRESTHWILEGQFGPSPLFQHGAVPHVSATDGGDIRFAEDGTPIVAGEFTTRFALGMPAGEPPADGWPVVLYAHGTGGDYLSVFSDPTATDICSRGFAVLSVDQIHHGDRNPTSFSPELLFFNFANPYAARDNNRQSALDLVQLARLVAHVEVPANRTPARTRQRLDPSRVYFFGHSQGGLNGALFLAASAQTRGGVLSGAGSTLPIALIEKTEPVSIPAVIITALGLQGGAGVSPAEREGLVYEHPLVSLIQIWVEPSDPVNYAPFFFRTPREGFLPKSIFQTEGFEDEFAPPLGIEALAVSAGIPLLDPVGRAIPALALRGIGEESSPVRGNVASGAATAGLLQYPDQGHYPALTDEVARARWGHFLETLNADGVGEIPAP